jgi:hypothetical protein
MSILLKPQTVAHCKELKGLKNLTAMPEWQTEYSSILAFNACLILVRFYMDFMYIEIYMDFMYIITQ